jgi:hypothetical protein
MRRSDKTQCSVIPIITAALLELGSSGARAQTSGPLFVPPFEVEHHLVQTDADGTSSTTPEITDYYGGSWIVSVRTDGSRLVVDLARHELTVIRPTVSTYATLGFDRLAEIHRRLRAANGTKPVRADSPLGSGSAPRAVTIGISAIKVERLPDENDRLGAVHAAAIDSGVVRLRVTAGTAASPIEVWCDPRVRLSGRAQEALAGLEGSILNDGRSVGVTPAAMVAAARSYAQGAFPVRTVRHTGPTARPVKLDDIVTRLAPLDRFPIDLVKVPDGYRRVPHPLEALVAFEDDEAHLIWQQRSDH